MVSLEGRSYKVKNKKGKDEMIKIVGLIDQIISEPENPAILRRTKQGVTDLCRSFPLYEDFHE